MKNRKESFTLLYGLAAVSLFLTSLIFLSIIPLSESISTLIPEDLPEDFPEAPLPKPSSGIHWHVRLRIQVNEMDIPIPAGIGLDPQKVQHTHDWDGVIHIEAPTASPEHIRLGKFFDVWGVKFTKNCLFQFCGEDFHMVVNSKEIFDFDDYLMQDGDQILIEVNTL